MVPELIPVLGSQPVGDLSHKPGGRLSLLSARPRRRRARVQIAAATLSGNSLRQTVHAHRASVHQTAKMEAILLRVTGGGNCRPGGK